MIIDLRSDTITIPTKGMLNAMMSANVGDDVWEEDYTVKELESKLASIFGMEAGLFCPSGTMTNQIAIRVHTKLGDQVVCNKLSHIYNYEGGGIASNSGASVKLLEDCMEAFLGAIYLDFNRIEKEDLDIEYSMGIHVAKEFINALIDSKVDFADLILNDYNYKDQLMKYFQKEYQTNPKYDSTCDQDKVYHAKVLLNGEVIEEGEGETKKKAEQDACRRALIKYGCIVE